MTSTALNFILLAFNITGITRFVFQLLDDFGKINSGASTRQRHKFAVTGLRPQQQFCQSGFTRQWLTQQFFGCFGCRRIGPNPSVLKPLSLLDKHFALFVEILPPRIVHQPQRSSRFCQPQVRVVFSELQSVLSSRSKHAVRLRDAACHQIINHDTDIGFVAARCPRLEPLSTTSGIQSGNQPLTGRLFITGGAIDLSCEIQPLYSQSFQRWAKVSGIKVVILNRIAWSGDDGILKTPDTPNQFPLHIEWQTGRDTVRIDFVCIQAFRLDKNLMCRPLGKSHYFVFYRRTIPRSCTLNDAAEQRGPGKAGTDNLVSTFVGVGDMTGNLARVLSGIS